MHSQANCREHEADVGFLWVVPSWEQRRVATAKCDAGTHEQSAVDSYKSKGSEHKFDPQVVVACFVRGSFRLEALDDIERRHGEQRTDIRLGEPEMTDTTAGSQLSEEPTFFRLGFDVCFRSRCHCGCLCGSRPEVRHPRDIMFEPIGASVRYQLGLRNKDYRSFVMTMLRSSISSKISTALTISTIQKDMAKTLAFSRRRSAHAASTTVE